MEQQSRIECAAKNFFWSITGTVIQSCLGFVSRTIFIYTLGSAYLGVNGLFTNILGVLSLAELGVGTAVSFSLYKPLAYGDKSQVCAYVNFYKHMYRFVALTIAALGTFLIPFLGLIVKDAEGVDHLRLIYCIYLFNTVVSYLISYKSTVLSADQKNYLITNVNTVVNIVSTILQIIALITSQNFILYLLVNSAVQFFGKLYLNYYTVKLHPYLREEGGFGLSQEEKKTIFTKVKALTVHKIGDVAINQTDNIIISAFINITAVGLVSNYVMVINLINAVILTFFNSAIAGLGNLIATESDNKKHEVFKNYDFIGFWLYGWSSLCLLFLLTPFIQIWVGPNRQIDSITVALLCCNHYMTGMRVPLGNFKIAGGIYEPDRWLPLIQAAVNLAVSVIGAIAFGLKGVYLGTLISGMIPSFFRPLIVYKHIFRRSSSEYYQEYAKRLLIVAVVLWALYFADCHICVDSICARILVRMGLCITIPNIIIWFVYKDTSEYYFIKNILCSLKKRIRRELVRGKKDE